MRKPTEYEIYIRRLKDYYRIKKIEEPEWVEKASNYYRRLLYTHSDFEDICSSTNISKETMKWLSSLRTESLDGLPDELIRETSINNALIAMYDELMAGKDEYFINEWTLSKKGRHKMRECVDAIPSIIEVSPPRNAFTNVPNGVYFSNSSAGKQQTELVIQKTKSVTSILSEGEQKAVALALFLAEIKVSHNKSAIILDDPVNSLDHKIIGSFANQLMDLDNQLIVFTHNKLFLDSFETTSKGHVCKGIDSACGKTKGKHIFLYETQSEGVSRKGIVTEKARENADLFLRRAEDKLLQMPLLETAPVCANIRQAIEEIIDEVVFNRLTPNKFSNKNGRINWDELKKLNPDVELIDKLHEIHGRCSGGELHLGGEREDNPVDVEELQNMCSTLRAYVPRS